MSNQKAITFSLLFLAANTLRSSVADSAAIVVLGHITSGQQVGTSASANLQVDKVLKGNASPGQVLALVATAKAVEGKRSLSGNGIWFLLPSATGPQTFNVVSPLRGSVPFDFLFLPVPQSQAYVAVESSMQESANDKVAEEIVTAFLVTPPDKIEFILLAKALADLPYSPIVQSRLQSLLETQSVDYQIAGLAGLLRNGGSAYLTRTLTLTAGQLKNHPLSADPVSAVAGTTDTSAQSIAALGALATSPAAPVGLRTAATTALEKIHTASALPFLAQLLVGTDENIQLSAIRGFSMFAENLPVKTPDSVTSTSWLRPNRPAIYKSAETEKYTILTNAFSGAIGDYAAFCPELYTLQTEVKPV
jgi:hypothetical protein